MAMDAAHDRPPSRVEQHFPQAPPLQQQVGAERHPGEGVPPRRRGAAQLIYRHADPETGLLDAELRIERGGIDRTRDTSVTVPRPAP
jgi:hypothetical protein